MKTIKQPTFKYIRECNQRIALLEAALKFYANSDNYIATAVGEYTIPSYVSADGGERARKALTNDLSDEARRYLSQITSA